MQNNVFKPLVLFDLISWGNRHYSVNRPNRIDTKLEKWTKNRIVLLKIHF